MITLPCAHCNQSEKVIKYGTNRSGSVRYRCNACGKTFTPAPNSRAMTADKEQQISALMQERVSQRGIARALHVGRQTIRALRKKRRKP